MQRLWQNIFDFWRRYEHHLGLGALIVGFSFDLVLAKRPDSILDNTLLLTYLIVAGAFIITLNLREKRRVEKATIENVEPLFLLLVLQFCFGGLASNLLVLYGKSGTVTASAIFIALLVSLVLGNEYLRSRYALLRMNIAIYYLLLLTYVTIATPVFITHQIGAWTFLLSGLFSLLLIGGFLTLLFFTVFRGRDTKSLRTVSILVGGIFIAFNFLYFFNFIPPVPLSLKDVGIYHSILRRGDGTYLALYEPSVWWQFWRDTSDTYALTPGLPGQGAEASCYSSVFAPTSLTTPVYHRWEHYDSTTGQWETQSRVSFGISGGRDEGYRGYTTTFALTPGAWRCDVETGQGQLIGRISFEVVSGKAPMLSQTTL